MKRNFAIIILLFGIIIIACEQAVDPLNDTGKIFVDSDPQEASIYIDGKNTGIFTPGEIEAVAGIHNITLKKEGYADYSFIDTITIGTERLRNGIKLSKYGKIILTSEPAGARIYLDEENTLETTPQTFSKPDGLYTLTLKTDSYLDTTFNINIADGKDIELDIYMEGEFVTFFNNKIIYDTTGAADNEPGGLSLSTGNVLNIKENSGQKADADLILVPNQTGGYEIKTPNATNGMFRDTRFLVSSYTNINDNRDAPSEDPTWKNSFPISTNNYVYVYDYDGHYSKIQIVNRFDNPTRVELKWIYNNNSFDSNF